jgi:hypothetical protein
MGMVAHLHRAATGGLHREALEGLMKLEDAKRWIADCRDLGELGIAAEAIRQRARELAAEAAETLEEPHGSA